MENLEFWGFIVDSASTLLAAAAVLLYIIFWFRDKTDNSYESFDSTYLEILKSGIEHPYFRDPDFTENYKSEDKDSRLRYEIYAFICWNFCETIYDKGDEELMKTWGVVIYEENRLHRIWFEQPENNTKFKQDFLDYIRSNFPSANS
jgi:hypothetical protein